MGKSKDGNVTCFMYTQMRLVGLVSGLATHGGKLRFPLLARNQSTLFPKAPLTQLINPHM